MGRRTGHHKAAKPKKPRAVGHRHSSGGRHASGGRHLSAGKLGLQIYTGKQ
ncbi:MAG: hypothetical protein ACRENL_11415 [Candidatus Dormibacteria bacterium]